MGHEGMGCTWAGTAHALVRHKRSRAIFARAPYALARCATAAPARPPPYAKRKALAKLSKDLGPNKNYGGGREEERAEQEEWNKRERQQEEWHRERQLRTLWPIRAEQRVAAREEPAASHTARRARQTASASLRGSLYCHHLEDDLGLNAVKEGSAGLTAGALTALGRLCQRRLCTKRAASTGPGSWQRRAGGGSTGAERASRLGLARRRRLARQFVGHTGGCQTRWSRGSHWARCNIRCHSSRPCWARGASSNNSTGRQGTRVEQGGDVDLQQHHADACPLILALPL